MQKSVAIQELEAQHGQKMIEVKVRFWTNDIATDENMVVPKHAWCSGVVRMERNKACSNLPRSAVYGGSLSRSSVAS